MVSFGSCLLLLLLNLPHYALSADVNSGENGSGSASSTPKSEPTFGHKGSSGTRSDTTYVVQSSFSPSLSSPLDKRLREMECPKGFSFKKVIGIVVGSNSSMYNPQKNRELRPVHIKQLLSSS